MTWGSWRNMLMLEWSESQSFVSNSLRPHGLYSPWNSPSHNTGVGSLSLLQGIFPTQVSHTAGGFFFFFLPAEPQGKLVREGSARMGIYNSSMIFVILFWEGLPYLPFAFVTLGCSMFLLLVLNVSRQLNEIRLQLSRMEEGHPGGSAVKNMLQYRRCGFNPCFGRRK